MVFYDMGGLGKPVGRKAIEHGAFAGDGIGEDNIESAEAVGGDEEYAFGNLIDVADFTAGAKGLIELGFVDCGEGSGQCRRVRGCDLLPRKGAGDAKNGG